jgi:hypothetical protein
MWISVIGATVLIVLGVILFAPWRVICRWSGSLFEVRIRFLGASLRIWKRDIFGRPKVMAGDRSDEFGRARAHWVAGFIERVQTLVDNQDTLLEVGLLLVRLARRFHESWHLEVGKIEIILGLGNPAHTGMALGGLMACAGILEARWPKLRVSGFANFDEATLYSRGEVVFRIRARGVVWSIAQMLAFAPWRGILKLRRDLAYQQ